MKILDVAKEKGVSTQAVYKRIKAAGYDVKKIQKEDGELTDEGLELVSRLYSAAKKADYEVEIALLKAHIATLEKANERLTSDLQAAKQALEKEQQRHDRTQALLENEQKLVALTTAKLPEPKPNSIKERIRLFFKG